MEANDRQREMSFCYGPQISIASFPGFNKNIFEGFEYGGVGVFAGHRYNDVTTGLALILYGIHSGSVWYTNYRISILLDWFPLSLTDDLSFGNESGLQFSIDQKSNYRFPDWGHSLKIPLGFYLEWSFVPSRLIFGPSIYFPQYFTSGFQDWSFITFRYVIDV